MQIAALVFDRITLLDIVGPMDLLCWLPGAEITWVGPTTGPVRSASHGLGVTADRALDDVDRADILVVPGGPGVRPLTRDAATLDWVRRIDATTSWTTSVCTGSLLLGAAGLLDGLEATTHWGAAGALEGFGATDTERRVVPQGKVVTAAGVSSGIDMALWLIGRIAGDEAAQVAQLCIEYDPAPPYDSGAPSKAPAAVMERARAALAAAVEKEQAA